MSLTPVPNTEFARAGVAPATPVTGDPTNGHSVVNDGKVVLLVANSAGSAGTVTVVTPGTSDGLAVADLTVSVPASGSRYIGPFDEETFGHSMVVNVTATTLTLSAYHMPPA